MTQLLHLDASARPGRAGEHAHGSQSRRLTHRFVSRWMEAQPQARVQARDLGAAPPQPASGDWIRAAFTPADRRSASMHATLAESDALVAELAACDVLVLGVPMYNFGMPSTFKAWIDNIVRVGLTFDFDRRRDDPYVPLLADRPRRAVLLTSRGGHGFGPGGPLASMNHLDPAVRTVLGFVGITELHCIAIEHEEEGGAALAAAVADAVAQVDQLVDRLIGENEPRPALPHA